MAYGKKRSFKKRNFRKGSFKGKGNRKRGKRLHTYSMSRGGRKL